MNCGLNLAQQLECPARMRFYSLIQRRRLNNCKNRTQRPVRMALLVRMVLMGMTLVHVVVSVFAELMIVVMLRMFVAERVPVFLILVF